jgi:phosphoesterase RecJ-like protein
MTMLTSFFSDLEIRTVQEFINQANNVVILTHMSPDGDAMGSSLAMRHFLEAQGKRVDVIVPNAFPDFLAWLPKANEDVIYEKQRELADGLLESADLVICTDFNDPKRIGSLGDKLLTLTCKKMMIDHHLHPSNVPDLTLSYPASPSTCELVYRLITRLSPITDSRSPITDSRSPITDSRSPITDSRSPITDSRSPITEEIATCIYTGMMTDTGNFSFNSNYPEMYQIVGELVATGIDKDAIYNRVFNAYSADRMRLMGYCLYQKMKIFPEHHTALIYLSRKDLYRFNFQSGDAEGIVNLPLQIKDVYYSCFMREDKVNPTERALAGDSKTKIKISLRSQGDRPVNVFAKDIFNGGGHANASGGEYYGPLPEAVQRFLDNYQDYFVL